MWTGSVIFRASAILFLVQVAACALSRPPSETEPPDGPAVAPPPEAARRAFYEIRTQPAPSIKTEAYEVRVRPTQPFAELRRRVDAQPDSYLVLRAVVVETKPEMRVLPPEIYADSYKTVMTRVQLDKARQPCDTAAAHGKYEFLFEGGSIPNVMSHGSSEQPTLTVGKEYIFALRSDGNDYYLAGGVWDMLFVDHAIIRDFLHNEVSLKQIEELCR